MRPFGFLLAILTVAGCGAEAVTARADNQPGRYEHVLLISIDGMHAVDLQRWIADPAHANSALVQLGRTGLIYPKALTTGPSDSFPGMIAQVTGGTPRSANVFYDDSYDRTLYAPGSGCTGQPGTETQYAENIDKDSSRLDAGGTLGRPLTQIDPTKLPLALVNNQCVPVYPHNFIRVNTLFEIVRAHGGRTAWSDKHPAYDILNGPSGQGIQDLFTPEVNSLIPNGDGKTDNTGSFTAIRNYDQVKVNAILNQIGGLDSTGTQTVGVPAIFGMNFQAVSVGQKLAVSGPTDPPGLIGGYLDAQATPGLALTQEFDFVDGAIGSMVAKLREQGLLERTLIIISAKHGQSPINPALRRAIDDTPYTQTPGYAFHIADDEALIWLQPQTRTANLQAARNYLLSQQSALGIMELLGAEDLSEIYRDPATDNRTPDFIALSDHGVIYTTGTKLAEHGGFSQDDRNVALLVSNPHLSPRVLPEPVLTTQIAPTILVALGLNPYELQGVRQENTAVLPELFKPGQ